MQKIIQYIFFVVVCLVSIEKSTAQFKRNWRIRPESYWNNQDFENTKWFFSLTMGGHISWYSIQKRKYFYDQDTVFNIQPNIGGGFNVGIEFTWKPNQYIEFKTNIAQLLLETRSITYNIEKPSFMEKSVLHKPIESAYLRWPLLIKINSDRINNFRVFMFLGGKFDLEIASNFTRKFDNTRLNIKRNDLGIEGGFGFHFYLPTIVLTTQVQMDYGFRNMLNYDPNNKYSASIQGLYNRSISIRLIVEGLFSDGRWQFVQ